MAEYERRKDKSYKPKIERTWQYNQFVREFIADKPRNAGKSIRDAAREWTILRKGEEPHTYAEYLRHQGASYALLESKPNLPPTR